MKKIFSFLTLAAALLCSGNAWAADPTTVAELQSALSGESGTVKLGGDINIGTAAAAAQFTINNAIVFDLNGHTLSGGGKDYKATFLLQSGSSLTITSSDNVGTIDMTKNDNNGHLFDLPSNTTLNLKDANVIYKKGWKWCYNTSGTRTVTAGSFNTDVTTDLAINKNDYQCIKKGDYYVVEALSVICTVNDVEYKTIAAAITAAQNSGKPIILTDNATYASTFSANVTVDGATNSKKLTVNSTISGGTFNGEVQANYIGGGTFSGKTKSVYSITGGTFESSCDLTAGSKIVGGTFNTSATATTCIEGGTFNAAAIATTYISGGTFKAAATAGTTISGGVFAQLPTVADGQVSGGKFTGVLADAKAATNYVVVKAGGNSIVTTSYRVNNGQLISGGSYPYDVAAYIKEGFAQVNSGSSYYVANNDSIQDGGIFTGVYKDDPSSFLISGYNCKSAAGSYFVGENVLAEDNLLIGGTFNFNPSIKVTNCVKTGYDVLGPTEGKYTIQLNADAVVAKIGSVGYPSLQKAITAATSGQTVTLEKDLTDGSYLIYGSGRAITFDLNGHTISTTTLGTKALQLVQFTQPITIKNSKTTGGISASTTKGYALYVGGGGYSSTINVIIESGTLTGQYAVYLEGYSTSSLAKVTINGGTFNGTFYSYRNSYDTGDNYKGILTLQGGNFNINPLTLHYTSAPDYDKKTSGVVAKIGNYSRFGQHGFVYLPAGKKVVQEKIDEWTIIEADCEISTQSSSKGTIKINDATSLEVSAGTKIEVKVTPNQNYKVKSIYTEDEGGSIIEVKYSVYEEAYFFYASEDATVKVNFVEVDHVIQNVSKGEYYYETLDDALAAVGAGETLKLLQDIEEEAIGIFNYDDIVIDLNNHALNLTYTGSQPHNYMLQLSGSFTIKNGSINTVYNNNYVIYSSASQPDPNEYGTSSTLTFENVVTNAGFNLQHTVATFINCNVDASKGIYHAIILQLTNPIYSTKAIVYNGQYVGSASGSAISTSSSCSATLYGGSYSSEPNNSWLADTEYTKKKEDGLWRVYKEGSRDLTSSNIGTICLPYNVAEGDYEGATFYQIAYQENNKVYFDEVTSLEAGKAYVFEPIASKITYKMAGKVADAPIAVNGLHGTFTAINPTMSASDNTLTGKYLVNSNKIRCCGDGCSLAANRAYIVWSEIKTDEVQQAPGRRRIVLGTNDVNTTTELMNANVKGKFILNGQFVIVKDGKMYNAQGAQL